MLKLRSAEGVRRPLLIALTFLIMLMTLCAGAFAQTAATDQAGKRGNPHMAPVAKRTSPCRILSSVQFLGMDGHTLLTWGLLFCLGGLIFGLVIYVQLKKSAVHKSMLEVSELIYETCKTYLVTQGKFIALLWVFIAIVIGLYFGILAPPPGPPGLAERSLIILLFSIIGILGSYGVAWFGIRVNTFANSRTAFAACAASRTPSMRSR